MKFLNLEIGPVFGLYSYSIDCLLLVVSLLFHYIENLVLHFLGFILEPKRSFFSPDLCILITCSSEKCIHINQEVLQALHFLPLVQESVNYFCAKILFSILIFCAADSRLIV